MRSLMIALFVLLPCLGQAAPTWQVISTEPGRRIEIDRVNMKREDGNRVVVLARLVLEKEINDPASGGNYRIVESLTRYECLQRNSATLKRTYYRNEEDVLREEELKGGSLPVLGGTLDDKVLREVCRPESPAEMQAAIDKANEAAAKLKAANQALIEKEKAKAARKPVRRPVSRVARPARAGSDAAAQQPSVHWGYSGAGGPEHWHRLDPRFKLCGSGQRQSPIDIRDGIRVDLEPIRFNYRPTSFHIVDNGHSIEAKVSSGSMSVAGKTYDLFSIHFHRPSEEVINGRRFDLSAHLVHKSDDGALAVVAVLMEKGPENPFVQTLWNNLPLEKNIVVGVANSMIDPASFLPAERNYYTYMGSLTTPPCTEGVLWMVLKQPVPVSQEQIDIFSRFYPNNARPVQPGFGRVIKEGR
ncbi:MAG: Carbonic anhydrase precursor [Betaproteobacteria bacterium ADurb.Bin341]|nr:MAG: Carbonic anhydrase precursor [Betaproteobacteria bacterium ADurb.Bin341]